MVALRNMAMDPLSFRVLPLHLKRAIVFLSVPLVNSVTSMLVTDVGKFEDDVVIFQNIKYGEESKSGSISFTLKRKAGGSHYYVETVED